MKRKKVHLKVTKVHHELQQRGPCSRKYAHRQKPRISGVPNRYCGYRDTARHLHDGRESIEAIQMCARRRHRHADDWQWREGRHHAW